MPVSLPDQHANHVNHLFVSKHHQGHSNTGVHTHKHTHIDTCICTLVALEVDCGALDKNKKKSQITYYAQIV